MEINLSHTSTQVAGCTVHNVDNGALAACFDKAVPRAVVEYIANLQPLRAVFRDSAFAPMPEKINVTEIFKNLSARHEGEGDLMNSNSNISPSRQRLQLRSVMYSTTSRCVPPITASIWAIPPISAAHGF